MLFAVTKPIVCLFLCKIPRHCTCTKLCWYRDDCPLLPPTGPVASRGPLPVWCPPHFLCLSQLTSYFSLLPFFSDSSQNRRISFFSSPISRFTWSTFNALFADGQILSEHVWQKERVSVYSYCLMYFTTLYLKITTLIWKHFFNELFQFTVVSNF